MQTNSCMSLKQINHPYKNSPATEGLIKKLIDALSKSDPAAKSTLLGNMTEKEFIAHRIDTYFSALEKWVADGHTLDKAEVNAIKESLHGLNTKGVL